MGGLSAQARITLNQTFSNLRATQLQLAMDTEDIQIRSTKGSRIIVETVVKISSSNGNLLEFMQNTGRYELEQHLDADQKLLLLSAKRLKNVVVVKGEEIQETLSYTIYLPSSIKIVAEQLQG